MGQALGGYLVTELCLGAPHLDLAARATRTGIVLELSWARSVATGRAWRSALVTSVLPGAVPLVQ